MASSRSAAFIVSFGGESYYLDRDVAKARSWEGRSVTLLDGEDISEVELIDALEATSFDGTDRVVVLDNANKLKADKLLRAHIEERDPRDDSVVLVAVVRSDKLPDIWKAVGGRGKTQEYPKFKPWQGEKIAGRIIEEAKRLKLTLAPDVPDTLIRGLGDNLRQTVNELRKLVHIVGEGGTVKKEHVMLVIAPNVPAEPFQVAEAVGERNPKRAMDLVSRLYRNLGDSASVMISSALMRQVEKLIVARQMLDKGDDVKVIATRFEMHEFVCQKSLLPMARKHEVSRLLRHMQTLCRLDAQVKGPARSKRTLVELAVLSIAS